MASGSSKTHGMCPACTTKKREEIEIEIDRKEREKIKEGSVRHCSSCGAKMEERVTCVICGTENYIEKLEVLKRDKKEEKNDRENI